MLIYYNNYMNITKRQKEVLFAIIEEYAETAAPVGRLL